MKHIDITFNGYIISSNKAMLQAAEIHRFLSSEAYWSKNIPKEKVDGAISNSYCIGIYHSRHQIGFSRIITDYVIFGYLADVYVLEVHHRKGLSKAMMAAIMELDWVNDLRRFSLATLDAQGLYSQFGFTHSKHPERFMEISKPGLYGDSESSCRT